MKVNVLNMEGEKVGSKELPKDIFSAPINTDLMHQAYVRQMANARLGTHKTKGRSDVSGGGRKPWRQKGTGRARQGSIRAAHWVGGGKVHTPKPRDYYQNMPKKMRRAALRSALSLKAAEKAIVLLDKLEVKEAKTGEMAKFLEVITGDKTALILIPNQTMEFDMVVRSLRNIPGAKTLMANYVNIRDLFMYQSVIMPVQTLDVLKTFLG